MKERVKAAGRFTLRNFDGIVVILVAGAVCLLEILGSPDPELVDSVTLAVLAVMAVVLLRDRHGRDRVDEIGELVQDLRSDRPYQVQSEFNRWEIHDGGTSAVYTKTQGLLFTRNEVCTLEHWCTGSVGRVENCHAQWRLSEDGEWVGAETIHDFGIHNGRNYIFSLDTERSRGDMLQWRVTRTLRDRFPNPREQVSLKLQAPTHRPRMHVSWPTDREPRLVEIRYDGGPGRKLEPQRGKDGRLYVEEELPAGSADSLAKIEWTW